MSSAARLVLLDGYSNIFRAFYAIRNLSNARGEPTNAVYGFLLTLRKLLRDEQPDYFGVAFDVSSETVRSEQYSEYKANRRPMPEDLRPQIPWIRRLLEAYRIPLVEMPGYEADDVLGTLARLGAAAGLEVVLVSADKDLMQLVGDGVSLYHSGRDRLYDTAGVKEEFGVPPRRVIDVLALQGDSVDNVPGVPGIGAKGARQLIAEHGSLEDLLEHADEVKRKSYRTGLLEHRDQALLSRDLVTIHTDLPIELDLDGLRLSEPDWPKLIELCWELDFRQLVEELEADHGSAAEPVAPADAVADVDAWQRLVAGLGADVTVAAVGGRGLAVKTADGAVYVDFEGAAALRAAVLGDLRGWLADGGRRLVGHDLKEVARLAVGEGDAGDLTVQCRLDDTMLMSYLLASEARSHELGPVALERLRHTALDARSAGLVGRAAKEAVLGEDVALLTFAAEQVELPSRMHGPMRDELAERGLEGVYEAIEEPLLPVLLRLEEAGIGLDVAFLEAMSEELAAEIEGLEEEIYEIGGERFNIGSPKKLGEIMFEKLGYPVLRRTRKTKSAATGADILEELAARGYELPERILRWRELAKLKSTYVDALPALVGTDGRLHTRFNQAVAATGRLSSANPNLQNIPIRTPAGLRIRKAFRAAPGHRLIAADYSQIELRLLAHIADEEAMIEAFRAGEDIHTATAAAVLGASPLLINSEQRRMAKAINFGIVYGISAWGLAAQLGIAKGDAQTFIDAYLDRYPGVRRYTEETLANATETLEVTTLWGRSRRLPDLRSRNYNLRENAKRMAINARIQGSAADLLKLAMIAVDRRLRAELPGARLLLTVHDELVLEAPADDCEAVAAVVQEEMSGVAELRVPLVVDIGIGPTWFACKS